MKTIDLTPLIEIDTELSKLTSTLSERYNCNWDDVIHDSFGIFVKQVKGRQQSVHDIRCRAELLAKEAEELKIDEQIQIAEHLCREADSV